MIELTQATKLKGELALPGDKSISHRAVILGAIANGTTTIRNFLVAEDTLSTIKIFQKMGVKITPIKEIKKTKTVQIEGVGLHGLAEPKSSLDAGNSGTAIRLLLGVLAGQKFKSEITGDESIQQRPMKRVTIPLSKMGASFSAEFAPIKVFPKKLKSFTYELPIPSAQVKSAILLAGLYAKGKTKVIEKVLSRDHTERMLTTFGANIRRDEDTITIEPGELTGTEIIVPSDISSAAFFIVAGLIIPGSEVYIKSVGINPTRTGLLDILEMMGAQITLSNQKNLGNEPTADIQIKSSKLKGVNLTGDIIPKLIDEIPILSVAMAVAKGRSIISGASELRVKESDRIKTVVALLKSFGAHVVEKKDGLIIEGDSNIIYGDIDACNDHRIAMSGIIMGLMANGTTKIRNTECIATSFPGFIRYLKKLGDLKIDSATN